MFVKLGIYYYDSIVTKDWAKIESTNHYNTDDIASIHFIDDKATVVFKYGLSSITISKEAAEKLLEIL